MGVFRCERLSGEVKEYRRSILDTLEKVAYKDPETGLLTVPNTVYFGKGDPENVGVWVADGFADVSEEQVYLEHGRQVLAQYHRDNAHAYRIPAAMEHRFQIEVEGVTVSGVIDRMDRIPGGFSFATLAEDWDKFEILMQNAQSKEELQPFTTSR